MPFTVNRHLLKEYGEYMAKKKSITRISDKKRGRPKVRFSFWGLILIFLLSFAGCFIIYMVSANIKKNFWTEEFDNVAVEDKNDISSDPDETEQNNSTSEEFDTESISVSNPVAQSEAKSKDYLNSCCLITDNLLLDINSYTEFKDVLGNESLSAVSCNTVTLETAYGNKTAYETLQVKKPENVYIMLGSDIGTSSIDDMISNYGAFVKNVRGYLTNAGIYVLQLPPVSENDSKASNALINEFNTKLLSMANMNNVYCLDTNTALKGEDGNISKEYINDSGLLSEKAYKKIVDYILCHTV